MIIEESIEIKAPLPVVWRVFSTMEDWQSWNTVCENCCIITGDRMAENTCFTFQMRPYYLPIKVMPTITKCEPEKEVIWEGRRFGVHAVHRFIFEEKEDKVRLTSSESFRGPLLWLSRIIFIPKRLHRLTRELMAAIKNQAEACMVEAKAN
jgi:hypothetical protein